MIDQNFWRNRRVFITGHTGFKGSWLSLWLSSLGARIVGYALPPDTDPSLFLAAGVAESIKSIYGDVRDLASVRNALVECEAEIVFHLAAQPLVRASYEDPVLTYSTNVMGTVNVLEAARGAPSVRSIVVVTSDKCYENKEWCWGYRENDRLGGHDPYSSSKACAELVAAAYSRSFFSAEVGQAHVATARAGNVIGGGDWASDRLVPDIMRACLTGNRVTLRNPKSVRPWQHVLEPLSGYIALAERLFHDGASFAGAWNFGPAEASMRCVGELTGNLLALLGRSEKWVPAEVDCAPHETATLKLVSSKASSVLGWRPVWSFLETVERTVSDYQPFLDKSGKSNVRETCLQTVEAFRQACVSQ